MTPATAARCLLEAKEPFNFGFAPDPDKGETDRARTFADQLSVEHAAKVEMSSTIRGAYIHRMIVPKEQRNQGVGSAIMQKITAWADKEGRRLTLDPAHKGDLSDLAKRDPGTSSYGRLVKFYRRFGFVQNRGRHADYDISDGMYRDPAKLDEAKEHHPKNVAVHKATGQRFWLGVADPWDGHIKETVPYEQAEAADFHHQDYLRRTADSVSAGESRVFWFEPHGALTLDTNYWERGAGFLPDHEFRRAIHDQISVHPTTTKPSSNGPVRLQMLAHEKAREMGESTPAERQVRKEKGKQALYRRWAISHEGDPTDEVAPKGLHGGEWGGTVPDAGVAAGEDASAEDQFADLHQRLQHAHPDMSDDENRAAIRNNAAGLPPVGRAIPGSYGMDRQDVLDNANEVARKLSKQWTAKFPDDVLLTAMKDAHDSRVARTARYKAAQGATGGLEGAKERLAQLLMGRRAPKAEMARAYPLIDPRTGQDYGDLAADKDISDEHLDRLNAIPGIKVHSTCQGGPAKDGRPHGLGGVIFGMKGWTGKEGIASAWEAATLAGKIPGVRTKYATRSKWGGIYQSDGVLNDYPKKYWKTSAHARDPRHRRPDDSFIYVNSSHRGGGTDHDWWERVVSHLETTYGKKAEALTLARRLLLAEVAGPYLPKEFNSRGWDDTPCESTPAFRIGGEVIPGRPGDNHGTLYDRLPDHHKRAVETGHGQSGFVNDAGEFEPEFLNEEADPPLKHTIRHTQGERARGFVRADGTVHTWPHDHATHLMMAYRKHINLSYCAPFTVEPDGSIGSRWKAYYPGEHTDWSEAATDRVRALLGGTVQGRVHPTNDPPEASLAAAWNAVNAQSKANRYGEFAEEAAAVILGRSDAPVGPREYVSRWATDEERAVHWVAKALKTARPTAVGIAAPEMAGRVTRHHVLVPIPDHHGDTSANLALAQEIARHSGARVADVLSRREPVASSMRLRQRGEPGLTAEDHARSMVGPDMSRHPKVALVDNLVSTGATVEGARTALNCPHAETLAWATVRSPLRVTGGGR